LTYLPASDRVAQEDVVVEAKILQGAGTILVVDDEAMILDVAKAILEKLGYRAMVAAGGMQAVETVLEREDEIDRVILDLIMPGIGGRETFERIRKIQPDMPVMLSSGYSIDGQAQEILEKGGNGFIQKPFQIAALSQAIRKIRDGNKPSRPL
jgi:CheY-like chemotaxis protein